MPVTGGAVYTVLIINIALIDVINPRSCTAVSKSIWTNKYCSATATNCSADLKAAIAHTHY